MKKRYEYKGKTYCEDDLSEEIGELYGGGLYDLYWELKKAGEADETKQYYGGNCEYTYDSYEELIEEEFCDLEVTENDGT